MISSRGGNHDQDPTGPPVRGGAVPLQSAGWPPASGLSVVAGRYRLVRGVATGPGWTCHVADDLQSGQQVRLRLVTRELADREGFVDRVHQHALVVRELSGRCPAIANLRDLGPTGDGSFFLALERDEGETVAALVQQGSPLALDEALRLTIRIGEAVEAAHNTGLIDGRLDPGRALVRESGVAVSLVDFGLDRAIGAEPTVEQVPWLAPEIASGGACSERTDVYAVGGMLYLLLTGHPPAGSWAGGGASQGGRLDVVPPGKLRRGLPRRVETIVLGALEADPARRHEDVSVLLNDLSESIGLLGRGDRAGADLWRLAGRWRVAVGAVGVAAAMAALWFAYPSIDTLVRRSIRDGASQSGREDVDPARAVQPRDAPPAAPPATPPAAPELSKPDDSTAATPSVSPPPHTAVPLPSPGAAVEPPPPPSTALPPPSPGPAVEPRATGQDREGPVPPISTPDPAGSPGLPLPATPPRPAPTRQMPALTRETVEDPARPASRPKPVRPAEREASPRSAPAPRADSGDARRVPASVITRPPVTESPRPVIESPRPTPVPREAPARDAGEDPGAIIDWLLRDRR
jgi:serine/threonine protein kinase